MEGAIQAQHGQFDVLIFDRMLPDAEGLDLLESLRGSGIVTPALMLTALGNSQNKVEGYQRGADDYLSKPTAHRAGTHLKLSPKEFDLLLYFMDHAGALITRDMLLRDVWNMHFDPGTNVVDVNIGRMRRKLDGNFEISLLQTVRGIGYRFGIGEGL